MLKLIKATVATAALATVGGPALGEGNLAARATRLEPLVIAGDLSFTQKEYKIETGKYYFWTIESKGGEEFRIEAPLLFRNAWIGQIVINDVEVHTLGAVFGIEFDEPGIARVEFVPIRPGEYSFYVAGFENRGMIGKFVVK